MKYLIDHSDKHDYIYLKTESVVIPNPSPRIVQKEIYACVDCGLGLEVYELEKYQEVKNG